MSRPRRLSRTHPQIRRQDGPGAIFHSLRVIPISLFRAAFRDPPSKESLSYAYSYVVETGGAKRANSRSFRMLRRCRSKLGKCLGVRPRMTHVIGGRACVWARMQAALWPAKCRCLFRRCVALGNVNSRAYCPPLAKWVIPHLKKETPAWGKPPLAASRTRWPSRAAILSAL